MSDFKPEDYPPHVQWATDPAGRRYWIQGVPTFGTNPLVSGLRAAFSMKPAPSRIGGMVTVERVDGDERTALLSQSCDTLADARVKAVAIAREIEAGTFEERWPN